LSDIETNTLKILTVLYNTKASELGTKNLASKELQKLTELSPEELNDAVTILEDSDYVHPLRSMGTAPYLFHSVTITARGKYEIQRLQKERDSPQEQKEQDRPQEQKITLFPSPVGSPYGFLDEDWELVSKRKNESNKIYVVFGLQFKSKFYDTEKLKKNVKEMFEEAIKIYKNKVGSFDIELEFITLAAGYGEHLFNKIARDIISSDIAVFDASDHNPNVMIEMGVALTWGTRVLPIRQKNSPDILSDISGQTWGKYTDNGKNFENPNHVDDLAIMIERAVTKKINKKKS